jgi:hypothetical protein
MPAEPRRSGAVAIFAAAGLWAVLASCAGVPSAPAAAEAPTAPATIAATAVPRAPAAPLDPRAAYERGVTWLIEHQNEDGSWGTFVSLRTREIYLGTQASHRAFRDATTALCTMALIAPARTDARARVALGRAVEHLLASEPSRRVNSDTFYNVWTHTYIVSAAALLLESGLLPERAAALRGLLDREVALLVGSRGADGGWGYYDFEHRMATPSGNHTTSFNTASALIALRRAGEVGIEPSEMVVREAIGVIDRMRLPSGAYVYGTYAQFRPAATFNMLQGSLARSQPCNLALFNEGVLDLAALERGLRQLREDHPFLQISLGRPAPHEAYYQNSGYYYLYGHYYAALAIEALPEPQRSELRGWLDGVLAAIQNPDGSWLDFPLYGYGHAYGTAYALLALEAR